MDVASRVAKNTGFLYGRIVVNVFISLFSTRLVLNALGVSDFGIYNVIGGAIGMLTFLNSAMTEATQRFMSHAQGEGDRQKQNSIFNVSFILHVAIALLIAGMLEVAGYFLFDGILEIPEDRIRVAKLVFQFMIVSTLFTIIKVPFDAVMNAHENMFLVALLGISLSILKLGIAIYITYTSFDELIVYGLLMALAHILLMGFSLYYCYQKYEEVEFTRIKLVKEKQLIKEMGSFAGWSLLNHSAWIITIQGTSIVLNSFFGVVVNAAQGIASQVTNQLSNFSITMQKALNPVIVKSEGGQNRQFMLSTAVVGSKFAFYILAILSVPVLIEMPYILKLWLKDVPEFAVIFCRLNLIRMPVSALTSTFYVAVGAIGNIKRIAVWESFLSICVLPVSYLLFQSGASPSVIYLVLLGVAAGRSIGRVYFLKKQGGLSLRFYLVDVLVRCIGVFVIAFAASLLPWFFQEEGFVRLLLVLVINIFAFFGSLLLFGLNKTEKKLLFRLIGVLANKIGVIKNNT